MPSTYAQVVSEYSNSSRAPGRAALAIVRDVAGDLYPGLRKPQGNGSAV